MPLGNANCSYATAGRFRENFVKRSNKLDILFLFILFVNLPVGAQLILLHLRGAQMTLAAFQEQFSFKFLPKTVIRQFWRSQCAWQRVPDPWSTHRKGTRTGSHCSCPRYSQFQMRRRTQKPTTRNRRNSDAVIGEVDGSATMETFVDQGGHLECHPPSNRQPVQIHHYRCDVVVFLGARYEPCRSILHTLQPVHQAFTDAVQQ